MNIGEVIINLIGGLGLFLYGMKLMRDGLQNAAGDRIRGFLEKITSNPVKGILVGTAVTSIIQSSSTSTVMVVGFVNAGLMNLYQAAVVIMGANIGATITAQLLAFNFTTIAPILVGIGAGIVLFSKAKKGREFGNIALGFGILFMGLKLIEASVKPISSFPGLENLIIMLSETPILGILVGMLVTAVVQSSSAIAGILIAIAGSGAIPLSAAIPILFGANIGTCVTAILSSIGTSKPARKAALFHLTFNVIGTIIFTLTLIPFTELVHIISGGADMKRQIANAHTLFNIINSLILVWFIPYLIKFVNKLIPGEDEYEAAETKYIDERLVETPTIAVRQVIKEIIRMADEAKNNIELSMKSFRNNDLTIVKKVFENEHLINTLESEIVSFLAKLSNKELSTEDSELITSLHHVVNDIERIGDHAENLAELSQEKIARRLVFSEQAMCELEDIYNYTLEALTISIQSFINNDAAKANSVLSIEERIDSLEKELRLTHIKRLNNGACTAYSGTVFLDMISNFERVADHAVNIAESVYNR